MKAKGRNRYTSAEHIKCCFDRSIARTHSNGYVKRWVGFTCGAPKKGKKADGHCGQMPYLRARRFDARYEPFFFLSVVVLLLAESEESQFLYKC